jgi:hypothetical protein
MSQIEDLLRRAYAEAAHTVTWADVASAVRVPEEGRPRRRRHRLAVPLLAAAATAVVAIAAAVIPGLLAHQPVPSPPASRRSGHGAPQGQQAQRGFFAALPASGGAVQIRSAATGQLIASVTPPAKGEFFSGIAATGTGGRTLLLAVERKSGACKTWLFQLRLSVSGQPGALTQAAIPYFDGILPNRAFTATPDGSAIAFAANFCDGSGSLEIDRPHTGVSASWATTDGDQPDSLSLSSDGTTLSLGGYEYVGSGPGAKPGTSSLRLRPVIEVLGASTANAYLDGAVALKIGAAALSPDGKTVYVCTRHGRLDVLDAYDVTTKTLRRTLATWAAGGCSFALDSAGKYALIASAGGRLSRLDIATGELTTLPMAGLPASVTLAW